MSIRLGRCPGLCFGGRGRCHGGALQAPLTASLFLFELTRDYEILLPALASAGMGSVIGDIVDKALKEPRRDRDAVSCGDLSDGDIEDVNETIQTPSS
jgi:Voltage gated chloride channel